MFTKDQNDRADFQPFVMRRPKKHSADADADVDAAVISGNRDYNPSFSTLKKMLNADGKFSCVIPLSHIFGFCGDIRKVIFGASHSVVLQRRGDSNLASCSTGGADGKVILTKIAIWMPYMTP